MTESIGKITPVRKYKTTDDQVFDDYEEAINHQEKINKGDKKVVKLKKECKECKYWTKRGHRACKCYTPKCPAYVRDKMEKEYQEKRKKADAAKTNAGKTKVSRG